MFGAVTTDGAHDAICLSSRIILSLLRLWLLREKVMGDDSGFFPSWVRDEVDSETMKDAVL